MSFPFGWNPPSLGEFIATCCNSGNSCVLVEADYEVESSFGKVKPRILTKTLNGDEHHIVLPSDPDDVLLPLPYVAHLCRRLQIPTEEFGFTFDYENGVVEVKKTVVV